MKKVKIGVMGASRGNALIENLVKHPEAEVVAICDKYEPGLRGAGKTAEKVGKEVALYTDFDEFIKHDMDAVVLANYAHEHAIFAVRCLDVGKHVLSEVLPCGTIAEGVELIEAVERTGLIYAYAENYCYMPQHFEAWWRIKNGELGEISYAEAEYVHDCTAIQPRITYGDPSHWRNNLSPTFYCTHSLGPMLMTIGKRPVQVVGYELPEFGRNGKVPTSCGSGLEMVKLENGAVCRSLHGRLRREHEQPYGCVYYGDFGMIESSRFKGVPLMNIYKEGDKFCEGTWEHSEPTQHVTVSSDIDLEQYGHLGSDFFPTHLFIQQILGKTEGKEWSIDVYQAVEMGICGILAYRSILNGNIPIDVPNFRNKEERDAYRNDRETTQPSTKDGKLVPNTTLPIARKKDEKYFEYIRTLWQQGKEFKEYPY